MFKRVIFQTTKSLATQLFRATLLIAVVFNASIGSPLGTSSAFAAADIKVDENCAEQIAHLGEEFLRQNRIGFIDPSCTDTACTPIGGAAATAPAAGTSLAGAEKVDAFSGTQITPTAIILHWTATSYDTPQQFVNQLKASTAPDSAGNSYPNGRAVQLTIDQDGKIYQLSQTLETRPIQTVPDQTWNDTSIGIEIESGSFPSDTPPYPKHENALLNNVTQYEATLNVVRELMSKYNIKNEANLTAKQGIFGHYEIAPADKSDPGANYMAKIRSDLNSNPPAPNSNGTVSAAPITSSCACSVTSGSTNPEIALNFFRNKLSEKGSSNPAEQAAGIVGNLQVESTPDIDPQAVNPSSNAYGIAQWLGGRDDDLREFAKKSDFSLLQVQLDFIWFELTAEVPDGWDAGSAVGGKESKSLEGVLEESTPEGAARTWENLFERSGGDLMQDRIDNAVKIFATYGSSTPASGSCSGMGGIDLFPLTTTKAAIAAGSSNNQGTLAWQLIDDCYHHDYCAADIHVPPGTPVVAAKGGEVVSLNDKIGGTGSNVTIRGDDDKFIYFYTHMTYGSLLVKKGDKIAAGTVLGEVGEASQAMGTAPHLHFDMLPGDQYQSRPNCAGSACSGLPFVDVQPILVKLYEGQVPD